ncbi:MAG: hypothetical protein ACYC2T_07805 [Bacillota bacterium]
MFGIGKFSPGTLPQYRTVKVLTMGQSAGTPPENGKKKGQALSLSFP